MIILEGADGAGKTTGGKILSEILGMELTLHSGGPILDHYELHHRIRTQFDYYGQIIDRSSIFSELIYGIAVREGTLLSLNEWNHYVEVLIRCNWSVAYFTHPGIIQIGKKWKSEEHMQMIRDKRQDICSLYEEYMCRAAEKGLRVIRIDWTTDNFAKKAFELDLRCNEYFHPLK